MPRHFRTASVEALQRVECAMCGAHFDGSAPPARGRAGSGLRFCGAACMESFVAEPSPAAGPRRRGSSGAVAPGFVAEPSPAAGPRRRGSSGAVAPAGGAAPRRRGSSGAVAPAGGAAPRRRGSSGAVAPADAPRRRPSSGAVRQAAAAAAARRQQAGAGAGATPAGATASRRRSPSTEVRVLPKRFSDGGHRPRPTTTATTRSGRVAPAPTPARQNSGGEQGRQILVAALRLRCNSPPPPPPPRGQPADDDPPPPPALSPRLRPTQSVDPHRTQAARQRQRIVSRRLTVLPTRLSRTAQALDLALGSAVAGASASPGGGQLRRAASSSSDDPPPGHGGPKRQRQRRRHTSAADAHLERAAQFVRRTSSLASSDTSPRPAPIPEEGEGRPSLGAVSLALSRFRQSAARAKRRSGHRGTPTLEVLVVTWNLGDRVPTDADAAFLREASRSAALVVTSVQECPRGTGMDAWEDTALRALGGEPAFSMLGSHEMGQIHVAAYVRAAYADLAEVTAVDHVACGVGNLLHNKGGVGMSVRLGASTLVFVGAHLAAHRRHVARRNRDFARIDANLDLEGGQVAEMPREQQRLWAMSDYVFVAGDLNYRIDLERAALHGVLDCAADASRHVLHNLRPYDQLARERAAGNVLRGFDEGALDFAPTFKFDPGTTVYDTSRKRRTPSWCDRILFKNSGAQFIRLLGYDADMRPASSDHKPVLGRFAVRVGSGVGLAGGRRGSR